MDQDALVRGYEAYLRAGGVRSLRHYTRHLRHLLTWLGRRKLSLAQLTPRLMNEHLCFRKSLGHKHATLVCALSGLRSFLRYARAEGLVGGDPLQGVSCLWLDVPGGLPAYQGPLRRIVRDPDAILKHRLPLFAPFWEEYLQRLLDQGYSRRRLQQLLVHTYYFHGYLVAKQVRGLMQVRPLHVNAFLRRQRLRFRKEHGHPMRVASVGFFRSSVEGFLAYAFERCHRQFHPPPTRRSSRVLPHRLLQGYLDFCRVHGGLRPITRRDYGRILLRLGRFLDRRRTHRIEAVCLTDLDAFLLQQAKHMGARALGVIATALRSFFRYLHLKGAIATDLAGNVLSPSRFRADLRPKYIPWKKVQQLLAGIDRSSHVGRRDYAILTLLAGNGLRAREAAGLRIDDLDWDQHAFLLRARKDGAAERIPMSQQTEQALRDYLSVRPAQSYPEVFLTAWAPIRPLGAALAAVAGRHLHHRFGRLPQRGGAYLLRHSFAKALLDRGAQLHQIGSLLGHKSLRSTLIYTRIATEDMREVGDNYAGLL
ncbi:MAG: tyrosine-type recombinase/integrase [Pseudomonadota bacterium]